MANLYLTQNAKFQPFSLEDQLKPYLMYEAAYKDVEDKLGSLAEKADVWNSMIDPNVDAAVYKQYKDYSDAITEAMDEMAVEGLRSSSRQKLLNLKRRYSSDIIPIEQAYAARAAEAKEQQTGKAQGIIYEGDAASSNLGRYMGNPQIRYGMADSKTGLQRVAASASSLAKQLREFKVAGNVDDYHKKLFQSYGVDPSNVNEVLSNMEKYLNGTLKPEQIEDTNTQKAVQMLTTILKNEQQAAGISNWANKQAQQEYMSRVSPGLWSAVGAEQASAINDMAQQAALKDYYDAKQSARTLNNEKDLAAFKAGLPGGYGSGGGSSRGSSSSGGDGGSALDISYSSTGIETQDRTPKTHNELKALGKGGLTSTRIMHLDSVYKQAQKEASKAKMPESKNGGYDRGDAAAINRYNQAQRVVKDAKAALDDEIKKTQTMYNKYKSLLSGKSWGEKASILNKFLRLEEMQNMQVSLQGNLSVPGKPTAIPNAIKTKITQNAGIKLLDDDGDEVSLKDVFGDDVTVGNHHGLSFTGNHLYLTDNNDKKRYRVTGDKEIAEVEDRMQQLNKALSDFSAPKYIMRKNIRDVENEIYRQGKTKIDPSRLQNIPGVKDYKQVMVQDTESGNILKIITDRNGQVLTSHSLEQEIKDGGASRMKTVGNIVEEWGTRHIH